jgi:Family of unknown function (DUF6159)
MLPAMERIRNSWELAKVSWSVLRSDKALAVFPALSAVGGLLVVGIFAGLVAATGVNNANGSSGLRGIGYVFIAIAYVALAFVTTYFLGALVHGANEALEGRRAALGECFAAANAKLHRLLPWALVQATVSVVIRAVEERFGFVGQIIGSLLGAAWAIVTFLTVPIIMLEDVGPIDALKRSGHLLKQSWGENIAAQFGFGLFGLVAMLPAILVLALAASSGSTVVLIAFGAVAVAWLVVVSLAISALTGIYRTALYRFAVDGVAPPAFAGADLQHAFGPRRRPFGNN